jgi:glyoxylase-like metal-dependent hydrolase (beta-lactamase superfamily II)
MTGPGTNTYLVGHQRLLVIDPGPDLGEHRAALVEAIGGREVIAVAVTHNHPDHAPGAASLARVLGAPRVGFADSDGFVADRHVRDGDLLGNGASELAVVHTPGHASAHVCFVLGAQGLCFTGDHVMGGSTVVIRPPDGHMGSYLANLERLRDLRPSLRHLAPGHGRLLADPPGAIDEILEHRRAREARVAHELAQHGPSTAGELTEASYPGLEEQRRSVATATLLAHLDHLVERGRARKLSPTQLGDLHGVYEAIAS